LTGRRRHGAGEKGDSQCISSILCSEGQTAMRSRRAPCAHRLGCAAAASKLR